MSPVQDIFHMPPVQDIFHMTPVEDIFHMTSVQDIFHTTPVQKIFPIPLVQDMYISNCASTRYISQSAVKDIFSSSNSVNYRVGPDPAKIWSGSRSATAVIPFQLRANPLLSISNGYHLGYIVLYSSS